jgi:hypothetical protein
VQSGLGEVRQNLLIRTCFLVQQARGGDRENLARLASRYCPPNLTADKHKKQFERLWVILRDCEPNTAAYAGGSGPGGQPSDSFRQIQVQGKDGRGRRASVRLDWVRVDGMWYVQGYRLTTSA